MNMTQFWEYFDRCEKCNGRGTVDEFNACGNCGGHMGICREHNEAGCLSCIDFIHYTNDRNESIAIQDQDNRWK